MPEVLTQKVRLLKSGNPNDTIFVLGATGSGKTNLMANLLMSGERWVIFDTRNEYYPQFFKNPAEIQVTDSLNDFIGFLNDVKEKIIFKVSGDDKLVSALELLYEFQANNSEQLVPVRVSIDETNRFCETNSCPEIIKTVIQRGRDYKINKILGAQWFGTLPTWMRDSFSEMYCFRHTDPRGLALLQRYGFNPDEVRSLVQYHCLHLKNGEITELNLVPENAE